MAKAPHAHTHKPERTDSIRTIELRRQIAKQVDPLRKAMRIANGLRVKGMKRAPNESEIQAAIYKLLDKFLPDLKAMEHSEDPDSPVGTSFVKSLIAELGLKEPGRKK